MLELNNYLRCPGLERALTVFPEVFPCPQCGGEVEIWSDEKKGRCSTCGNSFGKIFADQQPSCSPDPQVMVDILNYVDESGLNIYYERYEVELPPAFFEYDEKWKIACEACKRYGTNFACPPFSPTFPEYIGKFHKAKTICLRIPQEYFASGAAEDSYVSCFRTGKKLLEAELRQFREQGLKIAGAGPCLACQDCTVGADEARCRKPEKMIYSLESLGINLISLAHKGLNLQLEWNGNDCSADFVCVIGAIFLRNQA